ncbi:MAG: galactokinase [Caldilineaceae bacterium]
MQSILQTIYGGNSASQVQRYRAALQKFNQQFGESDGVYIFRAPGRVNLIGEHTDYNHGFVLPAALDKDIVIVARPRQDSLVRLANVESQFEMLEFNAEAPVPKAPAGDWSNYVRGAAHVLSEHLGRTLVGFEGVVVGAPEQGVPRGAGLSSSTAFTVVSMLTLAHFNQPSPSQLRLVQLCSDAEWYVGTRGGIMDQMAAFFSERNRALFLDCRPNGSGEYAMDRLPLPDDYRILVVDSGVKHSNTRGEFNQRVAACRTGVALLRRDRPHITHLRDVQEVPWAELEVQLPEALSINELKSRHLDIGDVPGLHHDLPLRVQACCRHVWSENRRVLDALDAMRKHEIERLGTLMNEAHRSARDDYRISCPEIEVLVEAARQVEGVAGARLTGAGWGGCVVALVHNEAVNDFIQHVINAYQQQTNRLANVFPCSAGPGAGLVYTG